MPEQTSQGIIPIRDFRAPLAQAGSLPWLIVNAGQTGGKQPAMTTPQGEKPIGLTFC